MTSNSEGNSPCRKRISVDTPSAFPIEIAPLVSLAEPDLPCHFMGLASFKHNCSSFTCLLCFSLFPYPIIRALAES